MFTSTPTVVAVASFGTLSLLGARLDPTVAFPALALFNLLRYFTCLTRLFIHVSGTFNDFFYALNPTLVSLASFYALTLMGVRLDATIAFPALALFNILRLVRGYLSHCEVFMASRVL